ncbi:MAG: glutamate 5-kinase [Actinomycetota bacterium]|jgi:glutamate 5-kinase
MRVVVKVGTSSVTHADGTLNADMFTSLAAQIAQLRNNGHEVLLVTSGAVAAGVAALGLAQRPSDMGTLQALAAIGQSRLMERYNTVFAPHGVVTGQVLLVPHDFGDRQQYLHARQTLTRLLEIGVLPVINENDAIANDEIRFGDNDRIAALVAHSVAADVLVLLTDQEGLYTSDPRSNADANLIDVVSTDDDLLSVDAGSAGTVRGSGGMASKLSAARIASWSGVRTVIARAARDNVLVDAVDPAVSVGTTFLGRDRQLSARRLWIAFAAQPEGRLVIDAGAVSAIESRGTSLLSPGVSSVEGDFADGDVVDIVASSGHLVARGSVAMSRSELAAIVGKRTTDLAHGVSTLVVHRDEMVVLSALR